MTHTLGLAGFGLTWSGFDPPRWQRPPGRTRPGLKDTAELEHLFLSLRRRCPPPLPAVPYCRSGPPLDLRRQAQVLTRRPEARAAASAATRRARAAGGTGGSGRGRRGGLGPAWLKEVLAAGNAKYPRPTTPAPPAATRAPHGKEFDGGRSSDDRRQWGSQDPRFPSRLCSVAPRARSWMEIGRLWCRG